MTSQSRQFCTFFLQEQLFGIEVLKIQEVMRACETTQVPLAPNVVSGLMNLRGSIVSCIDLRLRLNMPAAPPALEPINLIVQANGTLVSLQADRIGDVVEIDQSHLEQPPLTMPAAARNLVAHVYKLKDEMLQIVNVDRVVDLTGAE